MWKATFQTCFFLKQLLTFLVGIDTGFISILNLIAPQLPNATPLYIASIEKPDKEEQILRKKAIQNK